MSGRVYKSADRRKNHIGLNVSDVEFAMIIEDVKASGMMQADYFRAALEAYSGKKIFRDAYPNGARIILMRQQSAKETSQ